MFLFKSIKVMALSAAGLALAGGVLFGTDLGSYVSSSTRSVRAAVKDNIPMEFELKRARDLLHDIVPEMHANVKLIAQQEVEIDSLRGDINASEKNLAEEKKRIEKLRDMLGKDQEKHSFNGLSYSRDQLKEELSRRFERFKEAEVILAGKRRLMDNREKSLHAGLAILERTRSQKQVLEGQIQGLEAQHRLVQAAAVGSKLNVDNSKLAKTQKLIDDIKKQLDVAERVLAHEAKFTETTIPALEVVNEKELLSAVDEHLGRNQPEGVAAANR